MTIPTIIANYETTLRSTLSKDATSFELANNTDQDGNVLADGYYAFTISEGEANEEHCLGNLVDNIFTITSRNVQRNDGRTAQDGNLHRAGSSVKITNFIPLVVMSRLLKGEIAFSKDNAFKYDGSPTYILGEKQLVDYDTTKSLIDVAVSGVIAGNPLDTNQIAGENLPANTICRFKHTDGKVYVADKDDDTITEATILVFNKTAVDISVSANISDGVILDGNTGLDVGFIGSVYLGDDGAVSDTGNIQIGKTGADSILILDGEVIRQNIADALKGPDGFSPSDTNRYVTESGFAKTSGGGSEPVYIDIAGIDYNSVEDMSIKTNADYSSIISTKNYIKIPKVVGIGNDVTLNFNTSHGQVNDAIDNILAHHRTFISPFRGTIEVVATTTDNNEAHYIFKNFSNSNSVWINSANNSTITTRTPVVVEMGDIVTVAGEYEDWDLSDVHIEYSVEEYSTPNVTNVTSDTIDITENDVFINRNTNKIFEEGSANTAGGDVDVQVLSTTIPDDDFYTADKTFFYSLWVQILDISSTTIRIEKNGVSIDSLSGTTIDSVSKSGTFQAKAGDIITIVAEGNGTREVKGRLCSMGCGAEGEDVGVKNSLKGYKANGKIIDNELFLFN